MLRKSFGQARPSCAVVVGACINEPTSVFDTKLKMLRTFVNEKRVPVLACSVVLFCVNITPVIPLNVYDGAESVRYGNISLSLGSSGTKGANIFCIVGRLT